MSTSFPGSIQDLDSTRGTSGQPLNSPNHITHHQNEDDTIEALQAKVGIDGSAVATSLDYLTKTASDPGHTHTAYAPAAQGVTNGDSHNHVGGDGAAIPVSGISATGTPSASNYLRGDGTWSAVSGTGDVVGPASSTDGHIPQFDGVTGKLLKDGLAVVTTLGSPGADTSIPTEKAVRAAISTAGGGDVSGPASSTDNAITRFDSTTGKLLQNSTVTLADDGVIGNVNAVQLDITPSTITPSVGQMYWDATENTIAVNLDTTNGVTLQIGTENYLRVVNKTGSQINDGQAVYINGAQGNRPTIALARADAIGTSMLIGVATQNIADNAEGFITINGDVHGFNTAGFTAGDLLYLSATNAGELVNTAPASPNNVVIVATACNSTASGQITVHPQKPLAASSTLAGNSDIIAPTQKAVKTYADTKKYNHGVESLGAFSFSTNTFTIAASTNAYWYQGVRYSTSSAITVAITPADNTRYFISFNDATGTLSSSTDVWNLKTQVPVAIAWYNGSAWAIFNEKHNYTRDLDWHEWAHTTVGARYHSGLSQTNPTTANDALLQIESGSIHDEDIEVTISQQTTMRGVYKASANVYTWANYSLPYLGTSGQPQYLDTDTYTLTNVGANDFACMWVYATNDQDRPIHIIPTTAATAYATIALARAETAPDLSGLNLSPEYKLIYRFIYKGDGQYQEGADYRNSSSLPAGGTASTSASAVSFSPSGNIAATTVQTAIEELDTEKAPIASPSFTGTVTTAGAIELGNASDTTLARVSAGVVSVEGVNVVTVSSTDELTNKTLNASVGKGTWTASGTWTLPAMTFGGNVTLAENVSIVLDSSLSADGKYCGITDAGTAGETLAFGDIVYFKTADSKWWLADADAESTAGTVKLGICVLAANADASTTILLYGKVRADAAFPTMTVGSPVYVSTTAGDIQTTQPSGTDDVIRIVGYGDTADSLYFNPSNDYLTHT